MSAPLLPTRPAATDDQEAHFLIRTILEDMAVYPIAGRTEEDRLRALAGLDSLPVSHRASIGRFLIDGLAAVGETPVEHREWRMRRLMSNPEDGRVPQLSYAACNVFDEMTRDFFRSWVELRHHEMHAISPNPASFVTIGVLLTPRHDGVRPWDTTMMHATGDLGLTDEELDVRRQIWDDDALR